MDGFIVTNGEGQALINLNVEDGINVLHTLKDVAEVKAQCPEAAVYALIAIPIQYVPFITENRAHGMTKAAILHDMALRFIGTLPWPDGSLPDPSETAESLSDLDEPKDTWKE